ncbi:MAG: hypothetical protein IKL12_05995, partial [Alistipes sp.]|nr:hypothetical protein [Alistipes sp.]
RNAAKALKAGDDETFNAEITKAGEIWPKNPNLEKGRQQLALKRAIGDNILRTGYCLTPRNIRPELHPEQGTIWKWIIENDEQIYGRYTDCYGKEGAGALRKCSDETMEEIHKIFDVTGGTEFFNAIEQHSDRKAREMGFDGADEEYFMEVYTRNSNEHY